MPACSFCKENYEFPRGTTVVQKDSSVRHYCSSKCRKNSEMGRLTKKVKWVQKSETLKAEKKRKDELRAARLEAANAEKAKKAARKSKK